MGTGETGTPTKAAKVSTTQEQQTAPTPYAEWGAAFQAYYNSGGQPPPGYFPPSVGSGPQPHPYMWGGQPMMPGYGTPAPPYGAMYPHGGMYSHPSMPPGAHPYSQYGMPSPGGAIASDATATTPAGAEGEGTKVADRLKNRLPSKRAKGSDGGKGNSGSADGVFSQSGEGESGSEGSSEGSEDDNSQSMLRQRSFEQMTLEGTIVASGGGAPAYNGQQPGGFVNLAVGQTGGPGAQFGMPGKGSGGSGSNLAAMNSGKKGKRPSASSSAGMIPTTPGTPLKGSAGRDTVPPELWLQDEREVKRQRRKQSNRESARRSRLRKQAECEELGTRVDTLTVENMALRTELARVSEECKKLKVDNAALVAQLRKHQNTNNGTEEGGEDVQTGQTEVNGKAQDGSPRRNPSRNEEEASGDSPTKAPASTDAGSAPATEPAAVAAG